MCVDTILHPCLKLSKRAAASPRVRVIELAARGTTLPDLHARALRLRLAARHLATDDVPAVARQHVAAGAAPLRDVPCLVVRVGPVAVVDVLRQAGEAHVVRVTT